MHGLEETGAGQMRKTSRVVAVGLVSRERLERLPAGSQHRPPENQVRSVRGTGSAPFAPSRRRPEDSSALSPTRRRSLAPSTLFYPRERPRLPGRERKRGSPPLRCQGQQNNPLNGLLFRIVADPSGLRGRAPAHYPMLKNPDFRFDHY